MCSPFAGLPLNQSGARGSCRASSSNVPWSRACDTIMDANLTPPTQSADGDAPGKYRWALVGMLWFICFFNYADRVAISSVFPILQKQYHFTKTELGWIAAAFTWVY